jgi:hypothetical protein
MKSFSFLLFALFIQFSWSQVGIGVLNPTEALEVNGSIKMVDTNQGDGKVLVSDANGTASWKNAETLTDGVKTEVIQNIGGGTNQAIILWTHPEGTNGVEVRFHTGAEQVTVDNKTGDSTHTWVVAITGGGESNNTVETNDEYIYKYIVDSENVYLDLDSGTSNRGWFKIIASSESNEKDGFIMHIIYRGDNINGMVQYWDEP